MLLLARLADHRARRLGGKAQPLDDEGGMAEEMRLTNEMGERFRRLDPFSGAELQRNAVEHGDGRRLALREQQGGGQGHWP